MVGILSEIVIKINIWNVLLRRSLFDCFYMLYATKNNDDLENLKELVSLENQVKVVRLQDKLGKQMFHEDMKKSF